MQRLILDQDDFERRFTRIVNDRRESDPNIDHDVREIIQQVQTGGDDALRELTMRYDKHPLTADLASWRIGKDQCKAAYDFLDQPTRDALELAADRIRAFHERQLPKNSDWRDAANVRLGSRWSAVDAAGLYVPGGRASYPSSLLMNAIPAKVAGVGRLVVTTPTPRGMMNDLVLAAAHVCEVDEIWRIGGAQAIAALAYGTDRIRAVDVVTGPGNAYVAEAKRQLYGVVGIDMVAGPSEILVISDARSDPDWIAADLMSQAEHDPLAQSILITDDAGFADAVEDAIDVLGAQIETQRTALRSWEDHGVVIVVNDLEQDAPALANRLAAEHVELAVDDPDAMFAKIRHAGSVFLGRHTPEAVGDYIAGPNHVLPTGRRARFASGLSVLDFMKRTSFISLDAGSLAEIGPAATALADMEGLPAHAASVKVRL
ncbi:histidinol dehydrogenase [Aurantiacibacter spongiae]|uniref:Histidinol dehydrogenase n=2 Tax=Aurantiacibacter spongiae TaxID=2488860 RepID=A0A3N5CZZ5_9SPHN|nr:histidinol dehydrogenase [Aurantiacibacter spongiae]RPF72309.1 histidinol dehydrogenase [Aurantiacibacter spongiae]